MGPPKVPPIVFHGHPAPTLSGCPFSLWFKCGIAYSAHALAVRWEEAVSAFAERYKKINLFFPGVCGGRIAIIGLVPNNAEKEGWYESVYRFSKNVSHNYIGIYRGCCKTSVL
jgi:hypothetical protein